MSNNSDQHSPSNNGAAPSRIAAIAVISQRLTRLFPYPASVGLVAAAAGVSELSYRIASADSLTLIFLIAVVISARLYGLWPAVMTSILSLLCWDYFFTLPYYELYFSDPRDIFALVAFLVVALVTSGMTAQIRRQNVRLAMLADSITGLYRLSQDFSQLATIDDVANFTVSNLSKTLRCETVVVLRDHYDGSSLLVFPTDCKLEPDELTAAEGVYYALSTSNWLDRGTGGRYGFLPLNALHGRIGSVGISRPAAPELTAEERQKLDSFLNHAALAIERAWLARDIEHAQMTAETERLRNALLTSVSHDLRTPLTTIIGALSTLTSMGDAFSPAIRAELIATARSEADRLNRFVGNLLDITRLESGTLTAKLVSVDLAEVVETALVRAEPLMGHRTVEISLPAEELAVRADFAMLEQVIFNILDNAAKYSPDVSTIRICGAQNGDTVVLEIADEGEGIPEHAREKLFEKFTRYSQGDSKSPGTGLGLMICRGFLRIMNGTITASNRTDRRGAVFTLSLQPDGAP